jgi:hypothetical protein
MGLIAKHGLKWGGSDGSRTPVDAYEAAARLIGNPQATQDQRSAAETVLAARPGANLTELQTQLRIAPIAVKSTRTVGAGRPVDESTVERN